MRSASDLLNEWVAEGVSDPHDFKRQVLCQIPLRPLSNILNCVSFRLLRQTTMHWGQIMFELAFQYILFLEI